MEREVELEGFRRDRLRSWLFCILVEQRSPWDEAKLGEVLAVTFAIFDKLLKMRKTGKTFPRRRDLSCLQSSLEYQETSRIAPETNIDLK